MANNTRHRRLNNGGLSSEGAEYLLALLDEAVNNVVTTANPAALTSTTVDAVNATAPSATYVQAEAASAATLANELKGDVNALRADVVALRTTLDALMTELKA